MGVPYEERNISLSPEARQQFRDKEYDLLPATVSGSTALASDPSFGPFLKALPNAVQYPSNTSWAQVKTQIQHTVGTIVTGNPQSVLDAIQQTAKKGS